MNETPFIHRLTEKIEKKQSRFHVPGHKGQFPGMDFLNYAAPYDYTELPDTDSLYEAEGIILSLEERVAALYKSAASFLSCGGATLCIQTMLALSAKEGDTVIVGRGCHGSAVSAMALLGISPIWVWPTPDGGLPGQIEPEEIEKAVKEHPEASAVYLTSPNYFGQMADIAAISKICKKAGISLLVDNAHGAHLPFAGEVHPMEAGATMCADSAHKTLPALTGSAFLHLGVPLEPMEVRETMRLFGSTSPSYLMMASMDYAVGYFENNGAAAYRTLCQNVKIIKAETTSSEYEWATGNVDPMRITISARKLGYDGAALNRYLSDKGIDAEMEGGDYVVLVPTPFNSEEDMARLSETLCAIVPIGSLSPKETLPLTKPEKVLEPRAAIFSSKEEISIENATWRIAASVAAPCPPGVPLVVPGEKIDPVTLEILKGYGISHIKVVK